MRKSIGVLLLVTVFTLCAQGQARSGKAPQQAILVAVHVSGSERFTEQEVVAAAGLTVGATVTPADFQEAANKLVASGVFETVEYKYGPAGTGYNVTFKVSDNIGFMPVSYDNFVWFTDKELNEAVQKRVPLFNGAIASGGEMLDQVTAALQAFIAERGISGEVRFMEAGELGRSVNGGIFTIDGPAIHIKQVKFPGAAESEIPTLNAVAQQLTKAPYRRSIAASFAELNVRPIYLERGYLKVKFDAPEIDLLDKDPKDPVIAVTIPVTPGLQYTVSAIEWAGVKAFDANAIIKTVKLRPEAIANAIQLSKDTEAVTGLYGTKGYLRASMKHEATFDDTKRTVSYVMRVTEGDVYSLGAVDIGGLDKLTNARLRDAWKLREGEPYDTSYEREYMKSVRSMLTPNISVRVEKQINDKSHTVDLDLHFIVHADKVVRE